MMWWSAVVLVAAAIATTSFARLTTDGVIEKLCEDGDVYAAFESFAAVPDDARAMHSLSALQLILYANVDEAVALHKLGKAADFTAIPPLAKRHLDKKECVGLGDLFYVAAVIIKELVDTNKALPNILRALKTLITLTSDVGLPYAAEQAMTLALTLDPADATLQFRSAVLTPGVYESLDHINTTRALLASRIDHISNPAHGYRLTGLDEFTMSPTFYFVYQGHNDQALLTKLQEAYVLAHPILGANHVLENVQRHLYHYQLADQGPSLTSGTSHRTTATGTAKASTTAATSTKRKIRVGFVSSHFRRHSICKLFCGIMTHLDRAVYDVYAFSSLQHNREDAVTLKLRQSHIHYMAIGMTFVKNRHEVTDRAIDILIYLDVGMDPSTAAWAAARLAPIQMVIWGHPSTTGYHSIDYYLSSEKFHRHIYDQSFTTIDVTTEAAYPSSTALLSAAQTPYGYQYFLEQLVQFDTLGFYFERPLLDVDFGTVSTVAVPESSLLSVVPDIGTDVPQELIPYVTRSRSYYQAILFALQGAKTVASAQLSELITRKLNNNTSIALCPQHMPKFHPHFDTILMGILTQSPNTVIVLVDNREKRQWRRTLIERWRRRVLTERVTAGRPDTENSALTSAVEALLSRIVWVPWLTPQEYVTMLAIGDVMLDPYPFGGGVTTLESIAVCTPVVTLPGAQSVPQLAAGMLYHMNLAPSVQEALIVGTSTAYLETTLAFLQDAEGRGRSAGEATEASASTSGSTVSLLRTRAEVCAKSHVLYANNDTLRDWNAFLAQAVQLHAE